MVKKVFKIIAIMLLSFILWVIVFGATGRTFMWNAIEPAMQKRWSQTTLNDGKILSGVVSSEFDGAVDFHIR